MMRIVVVERISYMYISMIVGRRSGSGYTHQHPHVSEPSTDRYACGGGDFCATENNKTRREQQYSQRYTLEWQSYVM
jgi:hypothetical protein